MCTGFATWDMSKSGEAPLEQQDVERPAGQQPCSRVIVGLLMTELDLMMED